MAPNRAAPASWLGRWLRIWPDNIGTSLIAVLMLVVIVFTATSLVFYAVFRDDAAIAAAASQAADQVIAIRRLVERAPPQDRPLLIRRLNSPAMAMVLTGRPIVQRSDDSFGTRVVLRRLEREFPEGTEIRVDSSIERHGVAGEAFPTDEEILRQMSDDEDDDARAMGAPRPGGQSLSAEERRERRLERFIQRTPPLVGALGPEAMIRISVRVGENAWFNSRIVLAVRDPPRSSEPILFLTGVSLLVALVGLWGLRRAIKPLFVFAAAAERLGVDVNAEPMEERGPGEVRRAARAFNTMQTRLKRFIQDRTQMLAAISHDLRTPITRMKLRAEFVEDDEQRGKMLRDLDEMEAMIAATLAFARDDAANEPVAAIDLAALLAGIAADARAAGHDVAYSGPAALDITARPLALKRAVGNLVDNALKYGKRARIGLAATDDTVEIRVDDDGPGIPDGDHERVFAPFVRLEASRSRETGGTGLGLTITRNAIRSMGGDVELINRAPAAERGAGLTARVTLPLAAANKRA
jgi:signal transduction histidine kinase